MTLWGNMMMNEDQLKLISLFMDEMAKMTGMSVNVEINLWQYGETTKLDVSVYIASTSTQYKFPDFDGFIHGIEKIRKEHEEFL